MQVTPRLSRARQAQIPGFSLLGAPDSDRRVLAVGRLPAATSKGQTGSQPVEGGRGYRGVRGVRPPVEGCRPSGSDFRYFVSVQSGRGDGVLQEILKILETNAVGRTHGKCRGAWFSPACSAAGTGRTCGSSGMVTHPAQWYLDTRNKTKNQKGLQENKPRRPGGGQEMDRLQTVCAPFAPPQEGPLHPFLPRPGVRSPTHSSHGRLTPPKRGTMDARPSTAPAFGGGRGPREESRCVPAGGHLSPSPPPPPQPAPARPPRAPAAPGVPASRMRCSGSPPPGRGGPAASARPGAAGGTAG